MTAILNCHRIKKCVIVIALIFAASPAYAVNTGFLPGDCCFHFLLTRERYQQIAGNGKDPIQLRYSMPSWVEFSLCGYAGYWVVDGQEFDPQLKVRLRHAYQSIREKSATIFEVVVDEKTGKESRTEINPLSALIYNEQFDLTKYELFTKYNENWPRESIAWSWGGEAVEIGHYFPFSREPDNLMREWFSSSEVAALSVKLPVPLNATVGQRVDQAITLLGPVKLIVTSHKMEEFASPKRGMEIYLVTSKEVKNYEYVPKRGWVEPSSEPEEIENKEPEK